MSHLNARRTCVATGGKVQRSGLCSNSSGKGGRSLSLCCCPIRVHRTGVLEFVWNRAVARFAASSARRRSACGSEPRGVGLGQTTTPLIAHDRLTASTQANNYSYARLPAIAPDASASGRSSHRQPLGASESPAFAPCVAKGWPTPLPKADLLQHAARTHMRSMPLEMC